MDTPDKNHSHLLHGESSTYDDTIMTESTLVPKINK